MEEKPKKNYGTVSVPAQKTTTKSPVPSSSLPTSTTKKHSIKGITYIMLGSFSFSLMFLMVKLMKEANTFTLVTYRSIIQIIISLTTLLQQGKNPLGPSGTHFWLIIRALFGSFAVCAWFYGIQILPLPDAVTLQFTTPAFSAMIAVCVVGEKWLLLDMIGAAICLTGVALIAHPTWLFGPTTLSASSADADFATQMFAVLVTTGGAICAGLAYVSVRKIGIRACANTMVFYYGTVSIPMCLLGSKIFLDEWNVFNDTDFTARDYLFLLLCGLGGYGGQFFTNLGLQNETAATATLATSTQIVWTYIFELAFLHEALDSWSMGGTALILGYMLIVAAMKIVGYDSATPASPSEQEQLLPDDVEYEIDEDVA